MKKIFVIIFLISLSVSAQMREGDRIIIDENGNSITIDKDGREINIAYGVRDMTKDEIAKGDVRKYSVWFQESRFDSLLMNERECLIMNKRYKQYRKCMLNYLKK